jgi:hypothetical protein
MIPLKVIIVFKGHNSSVGITTKKLGFDSRQEKEICLFPTASRPGLGRTPPLIQWVPGTLSPGVKQPRREADHSPQSSAGIKGGGVIPRLPHMSSWSNT